MQLEAVTIKFTEVITHIKADNFCITTSLEILYKYANEAIAHDLKAHYGNCLICIQQCSPLPVIKINF